MLGWNALDLPSVEMCFTRVATILDEISQRTQYKEMHNFHSISSKKRCICVLKRAQNLRESPQAIAQLHCAAMGVSCLNRASARQSMWSSPCAVPRSDEWMPLYRDWCDGRSFNALLKDSNFVNCCLSVREILHIMIIHTLTRIWILRILCDIVRIDTCCHYLKQAGE